MATINLLEETANYLLNHCFVLGCVEEQRAKYLYIQDHLNEVRAVFKPLGYAVLLYPAPMQAAALVNEHEGSQARLLKYESILLLVLRLLYLQKRESLAASADEVLVTVEEVQAELQKMNLPRKLDQQTLENSCAPCAGTIWRVRWDGSPGWTAASRCSPRCCWRCRTLTLRMPPPRAPAPAPSLACTSARRAQTPKQGRVKHDRTQAPETYQLAQL